MEWSIFYLMIFVITILCLQLKESEEDKHFLREDNISLRNDLNKVFLGKEIFRKDEQKCRTDGKQQGKEKKARKTTEKKNRKKVFIFEDVQSEEEAEKMVSFRNLLEKHSVAEMILVSLKDLRLKMSDENDDSVVEEIFMLNDNPDNLSIIFCGGDYEDFLDFLYFCGWEEREDMEWIDDPWDIDDLKQTLKEIEYIFSNSEDREKLELSAENFELMRQNEKLVRELLNIFNLLRGREMPIYKPLGKVKI